MYNNACQGNDKSIKNEIKNINKKYGKKSIVNKLL